MSEPAVNQNATGKCPQCGGRLPAGSLAGLCPACLLKEGAAPDTAGEGGTFEPPPIAELVRLFPQLVILALLGKGGMGAVYKARQAALDRIVALKILPAHAGADRGFAERFNREARALARLSHPNIVGVHEFGQVEGLHFFIMEFVDGVNLRQLQKTGRLAPREALQIIPQICDALQYAHDQGVVHRDIKPENVLVDRKGRVKIADFGLAKILHPQPQDLRLTQEGQLMGTVHYMAPEQVEHPSEVDHRADIFSLGVVFYELLTGELPLGKFAPPSRKVQVDVRLDEVVLHALEKEPDLRYQQAQEVKTDLETITSGTTAPRVTPELPPVISEYAGRSNRRWKRAAVIAALIVLTGGASFVLLRQWITRQGLVASWPMEADGRDIVGNHNGVLVGACRFAPGKIGNGILIEGEHSGLEIPSSPDLNFGPGVDFSLEAWIQPLPAETSFGVQDVIDKREAPDIILAHGFALALRNGKLSFQMSDALKPLVINCEQNGPDLRDGAWHHIAVTVDRVATEGGRLYVDGRPVAVFDPTSNPGDLGTGQPLLIGLHPTFPSFQGNFRGGIDEVSIYRRALKPSEIQAIYYAGQKGKRIGFRGPTNAALKGDSTSVESGAKAEVAKPQTEWSPKIEPGHPPDPESIRATANALRAEGEYEAALQRYLWYWNHATEYNPGLFGVRLSFFFSDWDQLARQYPKAAEVMKQIRDGDTEQLLKGKGSFDLFMDVSALNDHLQREEATYELFMTLRQKNAAFARRCFPVVQPLLMKHGDYGLCLEYIGDPQAAFSGIRQKWEMMRQSEKRREENVKRVATPGGFQPLTPPKIADRVFTSDTCQLLRVLVRTGHRAEAEDIRDQAFALVENPEIKEAVDEAPQNQAKP